MTYNCHGLAGPFQGINQNSLKLTAAKISLHERAINFMDMNQLLTHRWWRRYRWRYNFSLQRTTKKRTQFTDYTASQNSEPNATCESTTIENTGAEEIRTNMYNAVDGCQRCLCVFYFSIQSQGSQKGGDTQIYSI